MAEEGLPPELQVTYRSLFDSSIQGMQHQYKAIFGIQGHPEGCPGPTELSYLFEKFLQTAKQYQQARTPGLKQWQSIPA